MINQNLIAGKREEIRNLGIAEYRINDKSETHSLESEIRKEYSWEYVAVLDPYTKAKGRTFRIFQLDPKEPSIPMGYTGMPLMKFEALNEDPRDKFIKLFTTKGAEKGYTYKVKKMHDDMVNFKANTKEVA